MPSNDPFAEFVEEMEIDLDPEVYDFDSILEELKLMASNEKRFFLLDEDFWRDNDRFEFGPYLAVKTGLTIAINHQEDGVSIKRL